MAHLHRDSLHYAIGRQVRCFTWHHIAVYWFTTRCYGCHNLNTLWGMQRIGIAPLMLSVRRLYLSEAQWQDANQNSYSLGASSRSHIPGPLAEDTIGDPRTWIRDLFVDRSPTISLQRALDTSLGLTSSSARDKRIQPSAELSPCSVRVMFEHFKGTIVACMGGYCL